MTKDSTLFLELLKPKEGFDEKNQNPDIYPVKNFN